MSTRSTEPAAVLFLWLGRALALLLFLFWGAFFLEHLNEWFLHPKGGFPPPWVWVAQVFHLGMMVGLLAMLRWHRVGALITVLATVGFFSLAGFNRFPYIALLNAIPIACFVVHEGLKALPGRRPSGQPDAPPA